MKEITYKINGTITDSQGHSMKFTETDIVNIQLESGITVNHKSVTNTGLEVRLTELIAEMGYHKTIKDLQKNYYVVLKEMKNLRDNIPMGQ